LLTEFSLRKRPPRAVHEVQRLVAGLMKTQDIRIDPKLN